MKLGSSLLAAALLSALAAAPSLTPALSMRAPQGAEATRRQFAGEWRRGTKRRYGRPGWSVAQGQRMARKARNKAAHRRACNRGGRR
jgi:hypothetical protein